jgi:hypothetical protein
MELKRVRGAALIINYVLQQYIYRNIKFERLTTCMVTQRKPKASKYLTTPTRPVQVDRDRSVAGLLEKMEGTGFGGRQLAEAHRIWLDMLGDNTTIMVAASGALLT